MEDLHRARSRIEGPAPPRGAAARALNRGWAARPGSPVPQLYPSLGIWVQLTGRSPDFLGSNGRSRAPPSIGLTPVYLLGELARRWNIRQLLLILLTKFALCHDHATSIRCMVQHAWLETEYSPVDGKQTMSVRRRNWTSPKGDRKTAWVVDYVDQGGDRHI